MRTVRNAENFSAMGRCFGAIHTSRVRFFVKVALKSWTIAPKHKQSQWVDMWRKSMRLDYQPILDVLYNSLSI